MHYPWWYVPFLTAPMLIALIAVVHVLVSHYAVGGSLFLAIETRHAHRTGNTAYLAYLKQHAWFFVLLTVVFGAITGVGIWWIIGLSSPLATEVLIHNFVFAWATEYVTFLLELVSGFIFFYYWGRLDPKTHTQTGFIYAWSAWISLVIITAITAFMLDPGRWVETHNFWDAFFNPQALPQILARTGGSFLLASLYVYFHAAFKCKDQALLRHIEQRSARPAILGSALVTVGGAWWYAALPASAKAALSGAAVLNVLMVIVFAVTLAVMAMLYFGPLRNPGWLSPGFALLFLGCGFAAVATGEYIREAVRKPYVSYNVVLGNQILAADVPATQQRGFLESGVWTKAYVQEHYPQVLDGAGRIDQTLLAGLPDADQIKLGGVLFQYHCNDCHAATQGMDGLGEVTRGWSDDMLRTVVLHPHEVHFFMPPWCGTPQEAELLVKWMQSVRPPNPPGMYFGEALKQERLRQIAALGDTTASPATH
jgi:cytochrome bd-type quinol oxidase subunit 1